jgi:hypothetical protein
MIGETNLNTLLAGMQPVLNEYPYVFCTVSQEIYATLPVVPLLMFKEREGVTVILTQSQAKRSGLPFAETWAWIELHVHSSLSAVGFIAAVSSRLAQAGISVNLVSAYYHDHLFVPWESRGRAMQLLEDLSAY